MENKTTKCVCECGNDADVSVTMIVYKRGSGRKEKTQHTKSIAFNSQCLVFGKQSDPVHYAHTMAMVICPLVDVLKLIKSAPVGGFHVGN